jgi:hypothetical protein
VSLGRATVQTMDLAAFRLDDVEPHGRTFRHKGSIGARLMAWTGKPAVPAPQVYPPASAPLPAPRDVYAWLSVEELIEGGH